MLEKEFISISYRLDQSGLVWCPEIGDEVITRGVELETRRVSILVDPQGLTPNELRHTFVWLPTVEQIVMQIEARQALLYHAGVSRVMTYETVIKTAQGLIETSANSLRLALGQALHSLLVNSQSAAVH